MNSRPTTITSTTVPRLIWSAGERLILWHWSVPFWNQVFEAEGLKNFRLSVEVIMTIFMNINIPSLIRVNLSKHAYLIGWPCFMSISSTAGMTWSFFSDSSRKTCVLLTGSLVLLLHLLHNTRSRVDNISVMGSRSGIFYWVKSDRPCFEVRLATCNSKPYHAICVHSRMSN